MLKNVFQRARPDPHHPPLMFATYSFPSGPTARTTLLYGVLAAHVGYRMRTHTARAACVATWLVAVVLVGSSRIYLGVHFMSDVLAAVTWSLVWLALCLLGAHELHTRARSRSA